jgi:hypothetical protein
MPIRKPFIETMIGVTAIATGGEVARSRLVLKTGLSATSWAVCRCRETLAQRFYCAGGDPLLESRLHFSREEAMFISVRSSLVAPAHGSAYAHINNRRWG